jgi:hypothetical protein
MKKKYLYEEELANFIFTMNSKKEQEQERETESE